MFNVDIKALYTISSKITVYDIVLLDILRHGLLTVEQAHKALHTEVKIYNPKPSRTERTIERLIQHGLVAFKHDNGLELFTATKLGHSMYKD